MQKWQAGDSACYPAAKDGTWLNAPSPPPAQTHPNSREMWAIPHLADEVLNLHVTQAELQNTAACPSYQMTWNSARSSAVTAGSLTTRETPAWLLNQSQCRRRGDPARTPSNAEMLLPPPCTARPQNVFALQILHAHSSLYVFIFHLYH